MNTITRKYDPWGPISTVLYEINNSDFVQNAISNTGVIVSWRPLTRNENVSHGTRIRAFRQDIDHAYSDLNDDEKGRFAQIVVKAMTGRSDAEELRTKLIDRLHEIGWTLTETGQLKTEDALISEQFFPPNSEYDAYLTVRDVLGRASENIIIEDAYVGSSLLLTLRGLPARALFVNILTVERNFPKDFRIELTAFRKQVSHIQIEIRTTTEFHDRFIVIDGNEFYHVGASIKDAGRRAFMISRIGDQTNIENLKRTMRASWTSGTALQ
jgi:hypothetical protein